MKANGFRLLLIVSLAVGFLLGRKSRLAGLPVNKKQPSL